MEWTPTQQAVLNAVNSGFIVGGPGTGKTTVLLAKLAQLVKLGHQVALTTFAFRGVEDLKNQLQLLHPTVLTEHRQQLLIAPLAELAASQLPPATLANTTFATNNQVRQVLRQLIASTGFAGTLDEAEHIIRSAKSRAKKLPESSAHYPLLQAYQARLEELHWLDRADLIRRHVIALKQNEAKPLPVQALLLDNVQDITELQLIWLQLHHAAGVQLWLAGDDDLTAYTPAGSLGTKAVEQIAAWDDLINFMPAENFRQPPPLGPAVHRLARQLRQRVGKESTFPLPKVSTPMLVQQAFATAPHEHQFLVQICRDHLAAQHSLAIITRRHQQAAVITHVLQKAGLPVASYARLVWDEPTPQLILATLYVMLNQANLGQLQLVMLGFGLPASAVTQAVQGGLVAENWLTRGAPLPPLPEASPTTLAAAARLRKAMRAAAQALGAGGPNALNPREVFKALVAELLPQLPATEHPSALLATDILLNLKGKLTEILPRVRLETLPAAHSLITVLPVTEARNHQAHTVMLPGASAQVWPQPAGAVLPFDGEHERRLFHLAVSRAQTQLIITRHSGAPSPLVAELEQQLAKQAGS